MQIEAKTYFSECVKGSYELDLTALKAIEDAILREFESKVGVARGEVEFEGKILARGNFENLIFRAIAELDTLPRLNPHQYALALSYSCPGANRARISVRFELHQSVFGDGPVEVTVFSGSSGALIASSLATLLKQYQNIEATIVSRVCSSMFLAFFSFAFYVLLVLSIYPIFNHIEAFTKAYGASAVTILSLPFIFFSFLFFGFAKYFLRSTELKIGGEKEQADRRKLSRTFIYSTLFVVPILQPVMRLLENFAK
jgi:hypothetical protein